MMGHLTLDAPNSKPVTVQAFLLVSVLRHALCASAARVPKLLKATVRSAILALPLDAALE